jgi:hypothetical protein
MHKRKYLRWGRFSQKAFAVVFVGTILFSTINLFVYFFVKHETTGWRLYMTISKFATMALALIIFFWNKAIAPK